MNNGFNLLSLSIPRITIGYYGRVIIYQQKGVGANLLGKYISSTTPPAEP